MDTICLPAFRYVDVEWYTELFSPTQCVDPPARVGSQERPTFLTLQAMYQTLHLAKSHKVHVSACLLSAAASGAVSPKGKREMLSESRSFHRVLYNLLYNPLVYGRCGRADECTQNLAGSVGSL